MKAVFKYFLFTALLLLTWPVFAQTVPDSVITSLPQKTDTIRNANAEPKVVESLKKYSERKGFLARIVGALLSTRKTAEELDNTTLVDNTFSQHDYKFIRDIYIVNLEPFGYNVTDTSRTPDSFLEKAGNAIHFKTHRSRIRNSLLFRKNELLEPDDLSESERLLRQTNFILDARLKPIATDNPDSVDVMVVTRDIWSLSVSGGYSPSSKSGDINARDYNFLGFGHYFNAEYDFGLDLPQDWAFEGSYQIPNISRSFVNFQTDYRKNYYSDHFGIRLSRDFYTFKTRHAGGLYFDWFDEKTRFTPDGPLLSIKYTLQDGWIARSFRLRSHDLWEENRTRLVVGGRIRKTTYNGRPSEYKEVFHNSKLYLLSAGLSLRKYFRDKYLFGCGYDNGEFEKRLYTGIKGAGARYGRGFGYIYTGFEFGSFYDGKNWEEGVVSLQALYFSKLANFGNWKLRQYISSRLSYGINRKPGESLNIIDENGIRGFNYINPIGTKRFVVNYESNLFSPFSLLGFRMAGVWFADFSWIAADNQKLFNTKVYQGYGIGLRFRNEYLIFSTIQLMFAYYPEVPADGSKTRLLDSSRPYYDFQDFNFSQPLTSPF